MNSLLQSLYMTPEFRSAVYRWQFKDDEPEGDTMKVEKSADGSKVSSVFFFPFCFVEFFFCR